MTLPGSPTYLVSGDIDICPTDKILRDQGRHVRHDTDVELDASQVLQLGETFVVVAHGSPTGTVSWVRSDTSGVARWLWVGMPAAPTGVRLYLYSCHVGKKLVPSLKDCDSFGHVDVVPMPDEADDVVVRFLDEVHVLLETAPYDYETWRAQLGEFVNAELVQAHERASEDVAGFRDVAALLILRKSLGYYDG